MSEEKFPFYVHCGDCSHDCSHEWVAFYFPIHLEQKCLCPMCSSSKVFTGNKKKTPNALSASDDVLSGLGEPINPRKGNTIQKDDDNFYFKGYVITLMDDLKYQIKSPSGQDIVTGVVSLFEAASLINVAIEAAEKD